MQNKSLQKNEWIESIRVLAMLLIILFHIPCSSLPQASNTSSSHYILTFFHSPGASFTTIFFLIAGYFTKREMSYRKWLKRIISLLIPFIIWNTLCAFGLNDEATFSRIYGIGSKNLLPADFPLWFVLSIIYITFLWPIWRLAPEILLAVSLAFTLWDNSWHCDICREFLPSPDDFARFLLGVTIARIPLKKLQHYFAYTFPIFMVLHIIDQYYITFPIFLSCLNSAFMIMSGMALCAKLCPKVISFVAKFSYSVFLSYASHVPIIMIMGYIYLLDKTAASYNFLTNSHVLIALVIFGLNVVTFRIMQRYIPGVLPFIAYHGQLPKLQRKQGDYCLWGSCWFRKNTKLPSGSLIKRERMMGFEPTTSTLARLRSTTELHPLCFSVVTPIAGC